MTSTTISSNWLKECYEFLVRLKHLLTKHYSSIPTIPTPQPRPLRSHKPFPSLRAKLQGSTSDRMLYRAHVGAMSETPSLLPVLFIKCSLVLPHAAGIPVTPMGRPSCLTSMANRAPMSFPHHIGAFLPFLRCQVPPGGVPREKLSLSCLRPRLTCPQEGPRHAHGKAGGSVDRAGIRLNNDVSQKSEPPG